MITPDDVDQIMDTLTEADEIRRLEATVQSEIENAADLGVAIMRRAVESNAIDDSHRKELQILGRNLINVGKRVRDIEIRSLSLQIDLARLDERPPLRTRFTRFCRRMMGPFRRRTAS